MVAHTQPIFIGQLNDNQRDCVDKLRECLEEAERGNIHSVAIVACMKKGFGAVIGGTNAAELNLGLDSLKKTILERITQPVLKM
jgi:hypothetical protein